MFFFLKQNSLRQYFAEFLHTENNERTVVSLPDCYIVFLFHQDLRTYIHSGESDSVLLKTMSGLINNQLNQTGDS